MRRSALFVQDPTAFQSEELRRHWLLPWVLVFLLLPVVLFAGIALVLSGLWLLFMLMGLL